MIIVEARKRYLDYESGIFKEVNGQKRITESRLLVCCDFVEEFICELPQAIKIEAIENKNGDFEFFFEEDGNVDSWVYHPRQELSERYKTVFSFASMLIKREIGERTSARFNITITPKETAK